MTFPISLMTTFLASSSPAAEEVSRQYDRWERRFRDRIVALHEVPRRAAFGPACDVTVGFEIGSDGRPGNATIRQSNCPPFHEKAARRLVGQLGNVGRIPSVTGNHSVVLKLSYGSAPTEEEDRQLASELSVERRAAEQRNREIVTASLPAVAASN